MDTQQRSRRSGKLHERHSAAWGKRLSLAVLLLTSAMFGQQNRVSAEKMAAGKLHPEVARIMNRFAAHPTQQVKVIVQYKQAPKSAALG
jgi:hypothetical protein